MSDDISRPSRSRPTPWKPRHGLVAPIVFLTVCTKNPTRCLASPEIYDRLRAAWKCAHAWRVGRYVVMPDHLHLFCAPTDGVDLGNWVRFWKSTVNRLGDVHVPWQSGFWDTDLRSGDSYDAKWHYTKNNPVRAGLVQRAGQWPFQGEIEVLEWNS